MKHTEFSQNGDFNITLTFRARIMDRAIVNITLEQIDDEGVTKINVEARRNDRYCFYESFTTEEKPMDVHLFTDKEINEEQAYKSVSVEVLTRLLEEIIGGKKTFAKKPNEIEEAIRFSIDLLTIKKFERLANVKFDYSKFKTLREFQSYYRKLTME